MHTDIQNNLIMTNKSIKGKDGYVDVVIVTYNSEEFISRCLETLLRDNERIGKIVIIDNSSCDGTVRAIKLFDCVELIELKDNAGFSRASNLGFKKTVSEYVMFLNPDCYADEKAVSNLLNRAVLSDSDCIIGPCLLNADLSLQFSARSFHSLTTQFSESFFLSILFPKSELFGRYFQRYKDYNKEFESDWITGAVMLMPRKLFVKVGFFDERFFMFEEDVDLCYRARKLGYRVIYYPGSKFMHCDAGSFGKDEEYRRLKMVYSSRLKYYCKHMNKLVALIFSMLVRIGFTNRFLIYLISGLVSGKDKRSIRLNRMRTFFKLIFARLGDEVG